MITMMSLFIIIMLAVFSGMLLSYLLVAAIAMSPVFSKWYTKKVVERTMDIYEDYEDEPMKD